VDDSVTTSGRRLPFAYRFVVALLRPLLMVLTKRDWRGVENLPSSGGFVVTPNHLSHLDPLVFAHFLVDNGRPPFFLGKEGVFRVPVVGAILRGAEQIPVYRNTGKAADAFRAAVAAIEEGKCVGVYPEGTLTRDPDLWPMVGKTGAARIALATRCPVIPVAQWGPQALLEPYAKKPRLFPRKTMHVTAGPPVDLSDLYDRPLTGTLLREATDRIMAAITAQLEQIRGEQAPAERFDSRKHGLPSTGNFHRRSRRGTGGTGGTQGTTGTAAPAPREGDDA
jgi:1-acyl-sn-glycerol-3-phosphate acyltransferase